MYNGEGLSKATWGKTVGAIVNSIAEHSNRGEVANLRRYKEESGPNVSAWKFVITHVPEAWWHGEVGLKWALIIHFLAIGERLHSFDTSFGSALAIARFSEARFFSLLEASPQQIGTELRHALTLLKSRNQVANLTAVAELILPTNPKKQREIRQKIARDYYATLHTIEKS